MEKILWISALLASLSELFPSFGLSYFLPRSKNIEFYDSKYWHRIFLVLIVWTPIIIYLANISENKTLVAIIFILISFSLRTEYALHRKYPFAGNLHIIGFIIIISILNTNCKNNMCQIKNILSVVILLVGAHLIGTGRIGSLCTDVTGRILFSIGFVLFIRNLISAHDTT